MKEAFNANKDRIRKVEGRLRTFEKDSRERTKDTETTDRHLKGLDAFKSGVREPTPSNTDVRLDSPRLVTLPLQSYPPRAVGGLTEGVDYHPPRCRPICGTQIHGVDSAEVWNALRSTGHHVASRGTIPPMRSASECQKQRSVDRRSMNLDRGIQ